jgi:hypothetical protein
MKYKVTIAKNGSWNTVVIDPGIHKCNDIVQVANSFGQVQSIKDKKDDVPVYDNVHIRR